MKFDNLFNSGIGMVLFMLVTVVINLVLLGAAVWVVVKVLQYMGVL